MRDTYRLCRVLNRSQDINSEEMNAKVTVFLPGQHLQDLPPRGAAVEAGVSEGLGQDGVDDLLAEEQLPALGVFHDVGDGTGGRRPGLRFGAPEVLEHGENASLAEGRELWVRRRLDRLGCDGIRPVRLGGPVATRFCHVLLCQYPYPTLRLRL